MKKSKSFLSSLRETNLLEIAWIFILLGTVSYTDRTAAESLAAQIDATHLSRLLLDGLALIFIVFYLKRIPRLSFDPINIFLFYAIFSVASTLWSASPVGTLGKSGEILIATIIVWKTLSFQDSPHRLRRLINIVLLFYSISLTFSLGGYLLFPELFSNPSKGLFSISMASPILSSNGIAYNGALLALTFAARYISFDKHTKNLRKYLFYFLYFSIFPFLAQGRTGMAILVVGTFLLFFRGRMVLTIVFAPFIVGGIFYAAWDTLTEMFLRGQNEQMVLSLSGRTKMWEYAWQAFLNDPFFGNGFAVGSRLVFLTNIEGFQANISSVHNGFFEVVLGVGMVGFIFWIVAFVSAMKLAVAAFFRKEHLDVAISFFYMIPTTIMSIGVGGWMSPGLAYFLATTAYLLEQKRREGKYQKTLETKSSLTHIPETLVRYTRFHEN